MTDGQLEEHRWFQDMTSDIAMMYERRSLRSDGQFHARWSHYVTAPEFEEWEERLRDKASCRNSTLLEDDTRWVRERIKPTTPAQEWMVTRDLAEIQDGRIPSTVVPGNFICAFCGMNSRKVGLVPHLDRFPLKLRKHRYGALCSGCREHGVDDVPRSEFKFSELSMRSVLARKRIVRDLQCKGLAIQEVQRDGVKVACVVGIESKKRRRPPDSPGRVNQRALEYGGYGTVGRY